MSPAQIEQRRQAGKASYKAMFIRAANKYDHPDDMARYLTGLRKNFGFRYKRGLTRDYVLEKCQQYGIQLAWSER